MLGVIGVLAVWAEVVWVVRGLQQPTPPVMYEMVKGDKIDFSVNKYRGLNGADGQFLNPIDYDKAKGLRIYTLPTLQYCPPFLTDKILAYMPETIHQEHRYLLMEENRVVSHISDRQLVVKKDLSSLCMKGHATGSLIQVDPTFVEAWVFCVRQSDLMLVHQWIADSGKDYLVYNTTARFTKEIVDRTILSKRNAVNVDYLYMRAKLDLSSSERVDNFNITVFKRLKNFMWDTTTIDLKALLASLGHNPLALRAVYIQQHNDTSTKVNFISIIFSSYEMRAEKEGDPEKIHLSVFQCVAIFLLPAQNFTCRVLISMPGEDHGLAGARTRVGGEKNTTGNYNTVAYINLTLSTPSSKTTGYLSQLKTFRYQYMLGIDGTPIVGDIESLPDSVVLPQEFPFKAKKINEDVTMFESTEQPYNPYLRFAYAMNRDSTPNLCSMYLLLGEIKDSITVNLESMNSDEYSFLTSDGCLNVIRGPSQFGLTLDSKVFPDSSVPIKYHFRAGPTMMMSNTQHVVLTYNSAITKIKPRLGLDRLTLYSQFALNHFSLLNFDSYLVQGPFSKVSLLDSAENSLPKEAVVDFSAPFIQYKDVANGKILSHTLGTTDFVIDLATQGFYRCSTRLSAVLAASCTKERSILSDVGTLMKVKLIDSNLFIFHTKSNLLKLSYIRLSNDSFVEKEASLDCDPDPKLLDVDVNANKIFLICSVNSTAVLQIRYIAFDFHRPETTKFKYMNPMSLAITGGSMVGIYVFSGDYIHKLLCVDGKAPTDAMAFRSIINNPDNIKFTHICPILSSGTSTNYAATEGKYIYYIMNDRTTARIEMLENLEIVDLICHNNGIYVRTPTKMYLMEAMADPQGLRGSRFSPRYIFPAEATANFYRAYDNMTYFWTSDTNFNTIRVGRLNPRGQEYYVNTNLDRIKVRLHSSNLSLADSFDLQYNIEYIDEKDSNVTIFIGTVSKESPTFYQSPFVHSLHSIAEIQGHIWGLKLKEDLNEKDSARLTPYFSSGLTETVYSENSMQIVTFDCEHPYCAYLVRNKVSEKIRVDVFKDHKTLVASSEEYQVYSDLSYRDFQMVRKNDTALTIFYTEDTNGRHKWGFREFTLDTQNEKLSLKTTDGSLCDDVQIYKGNDSTYIKTYDPRKNVLVAGKIGSYGWKNRQLWTREQGNC